MANALTPNVQPEVHVCDQWDSIFRQDFFVSQGKDASLSSPLRGHFVQDSSGNVAQCLGQIPFPDDARPSKTPDSTHALSILDKSAPKTNRSQRARHAAYSKHAKSKKAREDTQRKGSGQSATVEIEKEAEEKRAKNREKNRLAAAKCRAKMKEEEDDLVKRYKMITACNKLMKQQKRDHRNELSKLRLKALSHNVNECYCNDIHRYNDCKATEATVAFSQAQAFDMTSTPNASTRRDFDSLIEFDMTGQLPSMAGDATGCNRLTLDVPSTCWEMAVGSLSMNLPNDKVLAVPLPWTKTQSMQAMAENPPVEDKATFTGFL